MFGPVQVCSRFPNGLPERTSTVRVASTWLVPGPTLSATAEIVCTPAVAGTVWEKPWFAPAVG